MCAGRVKMRRLSLAEVGFINVPMLVLCGIPSGGGRLGQRSVQSVPLVMSSGNLDGGGQLVQASLYSLQAQLPCQERLRQV